MAKRQKDICPFSYWRAREGNSKCTGVVNFIKVWRQKDICMGKIRKDMCPFCYWSVVNVIKVRRQKDIRMSKSQKDMCPFSYWRAREGNSECTGKFQSGDKSGDKKKVICRCVGSSEAHA